MASATQPRAAEMPSDKKRKVRRGKRGGSKKVSDTKGTEEPATPANTSAHDDGSADPPQQQQQPQSEVHTQEGEQTFDDMFVIDTKGNAGQTEEKKLAAPLIPSLPSSSALSSAVAATTATRSKPEGGKKNKRGKKDKKSKAEKDEKMDDTTNTETRHVNQEKAEDFYSAYSYEEHGPPTTQSQGETLHPASYGILNPDLQSYIKNCEPMLDDSQFESSEDLDAFLDSVYQEIRGKEVIVMTDHDCSRILEKLLRVSNDYQIMHVFSCIIGKVPELVIHRFSSHVVQTLLTLTAPGVDRELKGDYMGTAAADSDNEQEDGPGTGGPTHTYEELVQALTKELEPHWAVMISDTYASHVIQTLLLLLSNDMATAATSSGAESLGSIRSKKSAKYASDNNSLVPQLAFGGSGGRHDKKKAQFEVPASFGLLLENILAQINESLSEIVARSYISHSSANLVLQQVVRIQAKEKKLETPNGLLDKLLRGLLSTDPTRTMPDQRRDAANEATIKDPVGSHFMQLVLQVVSTELYGKLYGLYFNGRLHELAFHPNANFVVQSLISNVRTSEQLRGIIDELGTKFQDLIFKGRIGVVRSTMDACCKLNCCHEEAVGQIYKAFDVTTDVERRKIVLLVAHLTPVKNYKSIDQKYAKINIQGALILQDWVKFPSAYSTAIAEGLVAMPVATMCRWARNSTGSRVIEAVLRSSTVPVKQKRKIVFNFSTHYTEIGCDKYGSHIVDACWEASNLEVKEKILREIRDSEARFQDSPFGRHVLRNCHLESYKRSPREWLVRMRGYEKRKQIMREIIEDGNVPAADAKKDDATGKKRSKRKKRVADEIEEDEIDTLFRQQDKEDKPNKSKKRAKKRNS